MLHLMIPLVVASMAIPGYAEQPCCAITRLDTNTGVASARETTSGRTFQFKVDAAQLKALQVASPIYGNFAKQQVSIARAASCCTIVSVSGGKLTPGFSPVGYSG